MSVPSVPVFTKVDEPDMHNYLIDLPYVWVLFLSSMIFSVIKKLYFAIL